MATPKLGLNTLSIAERVQLANHIVLSMTGNPHFPNPSPALGVLTTAAEVLQNTLLSIQATETQLAVLKTQRNDQADALNGLLMQEAQYVGSASGGDAAKIESAGMSVKAPPAPVGPMPKVVDVRANPGPDVRSLTMQWKAVTDRLIYEVQKATPNGNPDVPGEYTFVAMTTKPRHVVENLDPCTRYWVRVRAIGTAGPGPWSDPATAVAA